jgi:hypothetical protein
MEINKGNSMRKIVFAAGAGACLLLLLPGLAVGQRFMKKAPAAKKFSVKQVEVFIFSPLHVNCNYNYIWRNIPSTYGTVWVDICKADRSSCSGGITKSNTGAASFKTTMGMAGSSYVLKVYTQDRKYIGYSNTFFVDGMLPQCCPDGRSMPPCD